MQCPSRGEYSLLFAGFTQVVFQLDLDPILRSTVVFWHALRFLCDDPVADHLMAQTTGLPAQSVGLCRGNPDVVFVGVALLF